MPSEDEPRSKFKKDILKTLGEHGIPSSTLETVEKALDNSVLDKLFTRASATLTVTSIPLAARGWEIYFGEAATSFVTREKPEGGVVIHGSMHGGVVAGGGIRGENVAVGERASLIAFGFSASIILDDLRAKGIDVQEGERHLQDFTKAPESEKSGLLERFVDWARRHANELSSAGLAALAMILGAIRK